MGACEKLRVLVHLLREADTWTLLQWAHANGCKWNGTTCSYDAQGGHLKVLKWARENGCEWDVDMCASAGHLEVLKWARANGCAWDTRTCMFAAREGTWKY